MISIHSVNNSFGVKEFYAVIPKDDGYEVTAVIKMIDRPVELGEGSYVWVTPDCRVLRKVESSDPE